MKMKSRIAIAVLAALAGSVAQAGIVGTTDQLTAGQGTIKWTLTDATPNGDASLDVWTLRYTSTGGAATTYAFDITSPTSMTQVTSPALGVTSNVYKNSNPTLDAGAGLNLTVPAGKSSLSDSQFLVNTTTDGVLVNINPSESPTRLRVESLGFNNSPINLSDWDFARIIVPDSTPALTLAMEAIRGSDGRITDLRSGVELTLQVPEPSTAALLAVTAPLLLKRRRNRSGA